MAKKRIATFLGPNKGLSISGDRCYAYSGQITITSAGESTFFDFTTGDYTSVINLQYVCSTDSSSDQTGKIYLNDSLVYHVLHNESRDQFNDAKFPQIIVLPPNTKFKFTMIPVGANTNWTATIAGRIYA